MGKEGWRRTLAAAAIAAELALRVTNPVQAENQTPRPPALEQSEPKNSPATDPGLTLVLGGMAFLGVLKIAITIYESYDSRRNRRRLRK